MTTRSILAAWGHASPWHVSPWGVCAYRSVTEYELYSADYYGRGSKAYLRCDRWCECETGGRVHAGGWDDGHPDAIARIMARDGVRLAVIS